MATITTFLSNARQAGVLEVSHRLGRLLNQHAGGAQWWVDVVAELDELSVRLMADTQTVWAGLQAQLTRDAPHMSSQLRRLDAEQEDLHGQLLAVRLMAGRFAGDSDLAREVRDAARDLLHRLRRFEERTTQVLYEAYERDLGGESA